MLKIRLSRIGKKNEPRFRVVVARERAPVKGKFIESLGFYNPYDKTFRIDEEKLKLWLSRGAKPSPTVHNKLVDLGIIKEPKVKASKRKKKKKKEEVKKKEAPKKEAVEEKKEEVKEEEKKAEKKPKKEEKKEEEKKG